MWICPYYLLYNLKAYYNFYTKLPLNLTSCL
uniref:Uncharacterized protein n=1 Tax=Rhizophora mucronata TaxID=61149 RepID=A0A2P2QX13_RHIMU